MFDFLWESFDKDDGFSVLFHPDWHFLLTAPIESEVALRLAKNSTVPVLQQSLLRNYST